MKSFHVFVTMKGIESNVRYRQNTTHTHTHTHTHRRQHPQRNTIVIRSDVEKYIIHKHFHSKSQTPHKLNDAPFIMLELL